MNPEIKKRITAINNEPAVRFFFQLLNDLIQELSLDSDNEKLALNIRNDSRKRISVSLNSRLVLFIRDGAEIGLTVGEKDLSRVGSITHLKEKIFDNEPKAVLISFSFENLENNIALIKPIWLESCKIYEPTQARSQYRKHHIPELYEIANNTLLLDPYFYNNNSTNMNFDNLIADFRIHLKQEQSILKNFEVLPIKQENQEKIKWVWIQDHYKLIGGPIAHYEIRMEKNGAILALHFEGKKKEKDIFKRSIETLPEKLKWIKWQKSNSVIHKEYITPEDPDILKKLTAQLFYLEEHLGDQIRTIMNKMTDKKSENNLNDKEIPLNQILFGPPGTGKTYNTINKALKIINETEEQSLDWDDRTAVKKLFNERIDQERIIFTTFHQSMSYEDFVEGIKPQEPKEEGQAISYIVEDGIFKSISRAADSRKGNFLQKLEEFKTEIFEDDNKDSLTIKASGSTFDVIYKGGTVFYVSPHNSSKEKPSYPVSISNIEKYFNTDSIDGIYNPTYVKGILEFLISDRGLKKGRNIENIKKNFVLIIDEINRGNVSQIFGELITLIEKDKRLGKGEELQVTLPYSKEKFGVPSNLYIIGTMNTADRSVEALDAALRRRFSFEEMPPRVELVAPPKKELIEGIDLSKLLTIINSRIEKLLDRDHLIGHSYFMSVHNLTQLKSAFQNEIIPLLQEYFFGDYGKIGLVLGQGFFEPVEAEQNIFANFEGYDSNDFSERIIYRLKDFTTSKKEDGNNDAEFIAAINTLLKK